MTSAQITRGRVVRVLLIGTVCMAVCGSAGSQKPVPIERNKAWNHMMAQFRSAYTHVSVLHKFLIEHEAESRVLVYDVETFRAIDQAEEDLKAAQQDLQKIRLELEYKEEVRSSKR